MTFCVYLTTGCSGCGAIVFRMATDKEKRWLRATSLTLRAERGIAQQAQAETSRKAGIARTSYRLYEKGERSPTVVQLAAIAQTFGIPFSKLLGEIERRSKEEEN